MCDFNSRAIPFALATAATRPTDLLRGGGGIGWKELIIECFGLWILAGDTCGEYFHNCCFILIRRSCSSQATNTTLCKRLEMRSKFGGCFLLSFIISVCEESTIPSIMKDKAQVFVNDCLKRQAANINQVWR
jgi:hypothetical protein